MSHDAFRTAEYSTAEEMWEALSPTRDLVPPPCKLMYRGQADSEWGLLPTVLRRPMRKIFAKVWPGPVAADNQVWLELRLIQEFVRFCDQVGIRLPNDSAEFRKSNVESGNDLYLLEPGRWPNPKLLETMAAARHHGVPTRLLDWTIVPQVAAYFAASDALAKLVEGCQIRELAIWVLNIETIAHYPDVQVFRAPGSVSPNIAAQSGLFTVHPHSGVRDEFFEVRGLEEEFSILPNTPLMKLTLPFRECVRLLELCGKVGITAATMRPSADGAARADSLHSWSRSWERQGPGL